MATRKSIVVKSTDREDEHELRMPDGRFLAFVSPEDAESLQRYRWHRSGLYISRTFLNAEGKQQLELLQRHIALNAGWDLSDGAVVTFLNKNKLDCRRENLQLRRPKPRVAEPPGVTEPSHDFLRAG
jgi:hypothetical protein